jgi:hypothetical protein
MSQEKRHGLLRCLPGSLNPPQPITNLVPTDERLAHHFSSDLWQSCNLSGQRDAGSLLVLGTDPVLEPVGFVDS